MTDMVNIEGLNKGDVLAALYNNTRPGGMGLLQAAAGPDVMDRAYAEHLLVHGQDATGDYAPGFRRDDSKYFDYVHGRCLKVDLTDDIEFNPRGFDRDNGGDGTAQKIIDHLRKTGEVTQPGGSSFMMEPLSEEDAMMFLLGSMMRADLNQQR